MLVDQDVVQAQQEHEMAKIMGESLHQWFPGHLWGVTVDLRGGVAQVMNLALSGRQGFVLHLSKVLHDQKALFYAGGEILERYQLSRGKMNINEMDDLKRGIDGGVIGDLK